MPPLNLPISIDSVRGFLEPPEGEALHDTAAEVCHLAPCLEIGSYCGKSTIYLGTACQAQGATLFALDHHRGSEEHQPGEGYHDPGLYDEDAGAMDSFREFRKNLCAAGLENTVVPVVAPSAVAARHWATPLSLVFIDGGHSLGAAMMDYESWAPKIVSGGVLAIHDIFPNPGEGGQAPYKVLQRALASGQFEEMRRVKTLALLRARPQPCSASAPTAADG